MEDQISKKDLLAETGISYGQLYRWKRMGLIPEEWFERKSTFTGTETFFPRERMLGRIGRIQSMKSEDLSLEQIADEVAPALGNVALAPEEVLERGIAGRAAVDLYLPERQQKGPLVLGEVLTLYVLETLLRDGVVTAEEGRALAATMESGLGPVTNGEAEALLVRKEGLSLWMLMPRNTSVRLEERARVIVRVDIGTRLEELKSVLGKQERRMT